MQKLKWYADTVDDELEDVEKYSKAALYTKHTDSEASRLCGEIAKQEMNHAELFYQQGAKEYKKLKEMPHHTEEEKGDLMIWEYRLGPLVDHMAKAKVLLHGV